jgi:disulfide bond formation protein DsbB
MQEAVSIILAGLTVTADILIILLLVFFILRSRLPGKFVFGINQFMGRYRTAFAFLVSFVAIAGSLFFSEIAKFPPCVLCWWQRILMYPQTVILVTAIARDEYVVAPYLKVLNGIGFLAASYHYLMQRLPANTIGSCEIGGAVSCTKQYSLEFGYITIPLMAASAFLLNFLLLSFKHKIFAEPLIKKTRKSKKLKLKK